MIIISKDSFLNKIFKSFGVLLYFTLLKKTEKFSLEQKEKYQFTRLKKTLIKAKKVEYYSKLYQELNFDPQKDFNSIKDLKRLPILNKDQIKESNNIFINHKFKGIGVKYKTSGSTGNPMTMILTPYMIAMDKAMIFRHHYWATKKIRPKVVSIRSYIPSSQDAPLFKYNKIENNYYFSAYNLTKNNIKKYIAQIIKINPEIIRGYPSSISFFSEFISIEEINQLTNLKAIITSSESLTISERMIIENKFGNILLNWYGMTEPAVIIKEKPQIDGMIVCFEYGYYEFLDTEIPKIKKLITTSFNNSTMPFIRYDTGDLIEIDGTFKTNQIFHKIKDVIGRKDEYIIGMDGNKVPSVNFYTLFREIEGIIGFQIIQYSTKEILVKLKSKKNISNEIKSTIEREMIKRVGTLPVYIDDSIEFDRNSDGKSLTIIKKVGSYKLEAFKEYTLSTQKAWKNYYEKTDSFKLDWNEADYNPFSGLQDYLKTLLETDHLLKWYPETYHKSLLEELTYYIGENVNINQILLSHGSDNALRLIIQSFAKPDNVFLTLSPTYDNFRAQAETFGLINKSILINNSSEESLSLIISTIIDIQPRLIYISNPNNPIGYQFSEIQLNKIVIKCEEYNSILIIDEAYYEFSKETAVKLIKSSKNVVVLRTFSKAFGLAGIRLGYLISNEELTKTISLCSNPKDITMFATKAAEFALKNKQEMQSYIEEVNENKNKFYNFCVKNNIEYYSSKGNYVSFKVDNVDEVLNYLNENKIYIRDRRKDFNDSFVRVTIGNDKTFNEFLKVFNNYLFNKLK